MSEGRRFVILEHDHPFLHWDLMLEDGATLDTWRLLEPVHLGDWIASESLPRHRLAYLDYEGPVSNGRGVVRRLTGGTYVEMPQPDGAADQRLRVFRLDNCPIAETAVLRSVSADNPEWKFQ